MKRFFQMTAALLAAVAFSATIAVPTPARADDVARATNDAGLGLATLVANIFYVPVKISYAAIGSITGGLAYAVTGGNKHVAERVWVPSVGGDYVLTRDMISGDQNIKFSGMSDPDM